MTAVVSGTRLVAGVSLAVLAIAAAQPVHAAPRAADPDEPQIAGARAVAGPSVAGHVYDETGAALPGARVVVQGSGEAATTNLQGEFVVAAPDAAGPVTLAIDYLGRPPATRTVAAAERGRAVEIVLPAAGASAGDIVVTGASLLDNTARALNQQRQADNTVNVISADAIGRFPDPNIAEALQRVPGIGIQRDQGEGRYINIRGAPAEFSAVSVDGVQIASVDPTTRAVDLDTLPSDIVGNLEVTKSLLPDQDADSIAGAVNITTRSAFDRRGFALTGMAGGSYNQFGGTSDWRASGAVSDRFGADRQFGVLLSGSYSRTHRRPDNVENVWSRETDAAGDERLVVSETAFKDYDTKRERIAATGGLEWRPDDATRLWLRGSYARFEDDEYRNQLLLLLADGTLRPGATDTRATWNNARIERELRHRVVVNEIWTATAGAEHRLGGGVLRYTAAYTESSQTYPARAQLLYRSASRPAIGYDLDGADGLPDYSIFAGGEHQQEDRYGFRENTFRFADTFNDEFSGKISMEIPATLGRHDVTFTMGGKYRERTVTTDEERFRDRRAGSAPDIAYPDLLLAGQSRNFRYDLGRAFDTGLVRRYFDAAQPGSTGAGERRIPQSITADYTAREKVMAMFGMARFELGETSVIAGLRVEGTDFHGTAPSYDDSAGIPDDRRIGTRRADSAYLDAFPGLTVRHGFSPDLIGRVALTRAINRPNFVDIVPIRVENTDSTNFSQISEGNPALRPTLSNNADAGLEYYIRPLGIVSANAFYKDLSDFRFNVLRRTPVSIVTRPENADGRLWGVELNWQQQFGFLPGVLGGLGVFANYTYSDARIDLATAAEGRRRLPLPGQSKHMWNASIFYEQGPVNLRLAYTDRSDYLNAIDITDAALDLYWEGRGQFDVTASYQLTPAFNLFFEGKNLTNTAGVRYYGVRERMYEYEKFGYTLFGGVRVKL